MTNQDLTNVVYQHVGVVLCGNYFSTADQVVAVRARGEVFVVGRLVIGGVMHRSRGGVTIVNVIVVWRCWACRQFPRPVASTRVPEEGYAVIGTLVLLPWEWYRWWRRRWWPLLCWSRPGRFPAQRAPKVVTPVFVAIMLLPGYR